MKIRPTGFQPQSMGAVFIGVLCLWGFHLANHVALFLDRRVNGERTHTNVIVRVTMAMIFYMTLWSSKSPPV